MKKSIKIFLLMTLVTAYSFMLFTYYPKAESEVHLVQDAADDYNISKHFRMIAGKINVPENSSINLKGLNTLNISGSDQFSEARLCMLKDAIANNFLIIDVDLREESHGFINGIAVSWENEYNNANKGLTLPEVLSTEEKLFASIELGTPITFYNTKKTITPTLVQNEANITKSKGIEYIRIPVTDGGVPTDDMIKYFIDFVNEQPENTWLHFHCKAGIGRTTTFMIMYDIIKNYKDVSLNDIIKRQVVLSKMNEKDVQDFFTGTHFKFLEKFYNDYTSKEKPTVSYNNTYLLSNSFMRNLITSTY